MFKSIDICFFDTLTKFLKIAATKEDESIELVKVVGGSFKKAKFGKNFEKKVRASKSIKFNIFAEI